MTGKLIKYEIRSSMRLIGVIWAALIVASILVGISVRAVETIFPDGGLELIKNLFAVVPPIIYGSIFAAMIVVTVMIIILRFYRGILGDEGYLMHTLPVKVWQLITAKGVVAGGIVLASSLLAVLSILILISFAGGNVIEPISELLRICRDEPQTILIILEILIIMIASILKSVYQIYAAMAIGQLAGKFRILTSLGAYIGISTALTILVALAVAIANLTGMDVWLVEIVMNIQDADGVYLMMHVTMGIAFLITAIQLAAFHIIAERILAKKLNLI